MDVVVGVLIIAAVFFLDRLLHKAELRGTTLLGLGRHHPWLLRFWPREIEPIPVDRDKPPRRAPDEQVGAEKFLPAPVPPIKSALSSAESEERTDGSTRLIDQLVAHDPDSSLSRRLRSEGVSHAFPTWMESIAREMGGQVVRADSNVTGHLTWMLGGSRYYYYEMKLETGFWRFVSTRVGDAVLPIVQVRARKGITPFPAPKFSWPDRLEIPAFDDNRYEVRVHGTALLSKLPIEHAALVGFVDVAKHLQGMHVLEVGGNRCRLAVLGPEQRRESFREFLLDAGRLLQAVIAPYAGSLQRETTFQITDALLAVPDGQPVCRVCGEGLVGARIDCARCGTPHHADCWNYAGGCAIYACQGREGHSRGNLATHS